MTFEIFVFIIMSIVFGFLSFKSFEIGTYITNHSTTYSGQIFGVLISIIVTLLLLLAFTTYLFTTLGALGVLDLCLIYMKKIKWKILRLIVKMKRKKY
jgi:hypothetical protein